MSKKSMEDLIRSLIERSFDSIDYENTYAELGNVELSSDYVVVSRKEYPMDYDPTIGLELYYHDILVENWSLDTLNGNVVSALIGEILGKML